MNSITNTNFFKIGIIFFWNAITFSTSVNISGEVNPNPYEYIVERTPDRLKLISQQLFKDGIPDELINLYVPVTTKNEQCQKESLLLKNSLKKFDVWALKMWDSSGKLPSGILDGHFHDLGNYDECLGVSQIGPYHVKYCLIEVQNFLAPAIHYSEFKRLKLAVFGSLNLIKDDLYLARCIPASCGNKDLEEHYTSAINKYNMSVIISKHACTASNEDLPYNVWDWGTWIFLICTIVLVITSTAVDKFSKSEKKGILTTLLLCYSLFINFNQILTKKFTKTKLSFLSGLRGLAMIFIVLTHLGLSNISIPKINLLQISKDYEKPTVFFATAATLNLAVDIFFVMGGFLLSYLQIKNIKSGRRFNPILYYIRRFLRILPAYMSQIAICVTIIYRYVGSGPLWKINLGFTRDNCLKNWWTNLLFINNYVNQDEMCIGSNWFLAVDMQLYIIAPLIFLPMLKWKVFRRCVTPLLIIISNLWTFYNSYKNNYRAGSVYDSMLRTENTNNYIYITTQSRVGSWLMGLYLGYVISKLEENPKKKSLPKVTVWFGWSLTALILILSMLSLFYLMSQDEHINFIDALYNGFHRTIFASTICWIIYACALGYGGFIHTFFMWYPLQVLGRLSFMAYLSQLLVINGMDSVILISQQYKPLLDFVNAFVRIALVFILAFFASVLLEFPYVNMGRILSAVTHKGDDPTEPKEQRPTVEEKDQKYPKLV